MKKEKPRQCKMTRGRKSKIVGAARKRKEYSVTIKCLRFSFCVFRVCVTWGGRRIRN